MLSYLIYNRYMDIMNYPYVATMGIVLLVLSLIIAYGLQKFLMKWLRV